MRELDSILFSPKKYEERTYYTFKDILSEYNNLKEDYLYKEIDFTNQLENMLGNGFTTSIFNDNDGYTNSNYPKLVNLLVKRFLDKYCFYALEGENYLNKGYNFLAKLIYIMEMTSPRYLKLLEVYDSEKDKLLDPVKITSGGITRFKDTPQDEGDFANDEHTTNLTEDSRETSNELDTKMARLKEIESNYNNILLLWSNEFESIFIEEGNI